MQWHDQGMILAAKRFGEHALKLDVFTAQHGRAAGLIKGGASKKRRAQFDIGNMVALTWRGRLSEQLGQFTVELLEQPASKAMHHPLGLAVLGSASGLLHQCLAENHPEPALYQQYTQLLSSLAGQQLPLLSHYIRFEVELLAASGFPLDLQRCAATGVTEHLCYLSPKSGRAVSASAGKPYHDRLFALPNFMCTPDAVAADIGEVMQAFQITSYFLDHLATDLLHAPLCDARTRLLEQYQRAAKDPISMIGHNSDTMEMS